LANGRSLSAEAEARLSDSFSSANAALEEVRAMNAALHDEIEELRQQVMRYFVGAGP
jgi:hypothetical protein